MKKVVQCKTFDLTCAEETARYLDSLFPTLPKECQKLRRKASLADISGLNAPERSAICTITTDAVDGEKEVVLPDGIDLIHYQRNPVILVSHKMDELPAARAAWVKQQPHGMVSKAIFAQRPDDFEGPFLPDLVYTLVKQQILRGVSIGFIATLIRTPTPLELKQRPDWKSAEVIIEKCVLLEWSFCSVGMNPEALVQSVKGYTAADLRRLGLPLPKRKPVDLAKVIDAIDFDVEAIVAKALSNIRNRGRLD